MARQSSLHLRDEAAATISGTGHLTVASRATIDVVGRFAEAHVTRAWSDRSDYRFIIVAT
jgi:hypothetical protein